MIALLLPHTGAHVAPHAAVLPVLPLIFRRAVAAVRRKPAVPAALNPAGAATPTALLGEPRQHDGLSDAEIAALRPRKVLPRADGDIVIDERNSVHVRPVNGRLLGDLPRRRAEPGKPPWWTTEHLVYQQAPQLAIEPGLTEAMLP